MADLQIEDVPDEICERLRSCATRRGITVRQVVLDAVRHELEHELGYVALETREPVDLGGSAADILREVRKERSR